MLTPTSFLTFLTLPLTPLAYSSPLTRRAADDTTYWPVPSFAITYTPSGTSNSSLNFTVEWSRGVATCATSFPFNELPTRNIYCDEEKRNPTFNLTATDEGVFNETGFRVNVKGSVRYATNYNAIS
jgi:hypothetical protein